MRPQLDLSRILSDLPWAVVGAVAAARYMPERATQDIDIVILPRDRDEASRRLAQAGYRREASLSIGGSSWVALDGTPLDVIEGSEHWWPAALEKTLDFDGLPVVAAKYLVLMKAQASRVQVLPMSPVFSDACPMQIWWESVI